MKKLQLIALVLSLAFVTAGPALAAPAQRFPLPDEVITDFNPCTGAFVDITLTDQVLVIHDDVDPMGGHHITGTVTGRFETADGFSGRFTVWFGTNHDNTSHTGLFEATETFSATGGDGSGARIVIRGVLHITEKDGVVISEVDQFDLSCRGKPS